MKTRLCASFLACLFLGVCRAQVQETEDVVPIRHADAHEVFVTIHDLTSTTQVHVTTYGTSLILRGPKDAVAAIEEVIKKLDVAPAPKRNIDLTVYMIMASQQPVAESLPAGLEDVAKQLKAVFPYRGYRLLDNFVLRARDGQSGDSSGASVLTSTKIMYAFHFQHVSLPSGDAAQGVRLDDLRLSLKVPLRGNFEEASIRTDVDVPEGKKVVVGKTNIVEGVEGAVFLVISAKVVD
jgi:hypothetical protein